MKKNITQKIKKNDKYKQIREKKKKNQKKQKKRKNKKEFSTEQILVWKIKYHKKEKINSKYFRG